MKKCVASYGLTQNDSSVSIVHSLLDVECALVQSLLTERLHLRNSSIAR
jgi:hypothetical protein